VSLLKTGLLKTEHVALVGAVMTAGALAGCRGEKSADPPFHLISDMQNQAHRLPQSTSPLFADGRSNRRAEEHTIAVGHLKEDDAFFRGVDATGKPIKRVPFEVTQKTVDRGRDRFNIYCTPCHDKTGSGNGTVVQRGFVKPPQLFAEHAQSLTDGEIFGIISKGQNNMPSYAAQIPEDDRWAIVTWVRVLQQSQAAKVDDIPAAERGKIEAPESEAK
jgi:mono/diheme cytochrome c family protein